MFDFLAGLLSRISPTRRMLGSRGVGQAWEDLAAAHLRRSGYQILERNFRCQPGEIDFIAMDGPVLCFVEVKGRHGLRFGLPEEAVTVEKQRRIFLAAQEYLRRARPAPGQRRFDVVSILEGEGRPAIRILRNAFEGPPARRRRPGGHPAC